ncbi:MAG: aspartate/glutamate racemase family protein [Pseudomonadota bacterium]
MGYVAKGGKTIAGARIGMLLLESQFPRIVGDGGNARTWPFPMLYEVVTGANPRNVVLEDARALLPLFSEAAKRLVARGADGITTNCGFLVLLQDALADACGAPVAASSLLQVPWVQPLLPPTQRVGVITISERTLTPAHLTAAGAPLDTPIVGTESGDTFYRVIVNDELSLDVDKARDDIIRAGQSLCDAHPDVGAIVLECTNMSPYSRALSVAVERPVYDFYSFVSWFHTGLSPRRFRLD